MINNSILLGKYIYNFLMNNVELLKYLNGNIFPLICDEDINFPFVIYGRNSLVPTYMKDGLCEDQVSFTFHIVSNLYTEALEIANLVRETLECKRYADDKINIIQMRLENVTESFEENAYIETLEISVKCGR